jgi:hypothetical protein
MMPLEPLPPPSPRGNTCPPPQNTGVWPCSPAKFVSLPLGRCTISSQLARLRPTTPLPSFQSLSWTILPLTLSTGLGPQSQAPTRGNHSASHASPLPARNLIIKWSDGLWTCSIHSRPTYPPEYSTMAKFPPPWFTSIRAICSSISTVNSLPLRLPSNPPFLPH